jgi:carboxylesterase type B
MHHLVAQGGTLDPLFQRAIVFSPAFYPTYERKGVIETVYKQFEAAAGCSGQGLQCLRLAPADVLRKANVATNLNVVAGSFPYGPTPDGTLIRQLPALELASGS